MKKGKKKSKNDILDRAVEELLGDEDVSFDREGKSDEKPIRSVPMTDIVEKAAYKFQEDIKPLKESTWRLIKQLKAEFEQMQRMKGKFWSLVDVEMDLSSHQFRMQMNVENSEIEIYEDAYDMDDED